MNANFKQLYIKNELQIKDLDKYVDRWNQIKMNISLQEFLVFSDEEYTAFAHSEAALNKMLDSLKNNECQKIALLIRFWI